MNLCKRTIVIEVPFMNCTALNPTIRTQQNLLSGRVPVDVLDVNLDMIGSGSLLTACLAAGDVIRVNQILTLQKVLLRPYGGIGLTGRL